MILFKLYTSRNKQIYFALAKKYRTTAWYIYKLAHGKKVRVTGKTAEILNELKTLNIIQNVRV